MNYFVGTISHGTTGVKTITCGFQPIGARITVGQKTLTTQNFSHKSVGVTDGATQICDTFYQDTTAGSTQRSNAKLVSVLENSAGTITEVAAAAFDSFTATALKYNVTTANSAYQYLVEIWG